MRHMFGSDMNLLASFRVTPHSRWPYIDAETTETSDLNAAMLSNNNWTDSAES